jgi:hypothetical protein
VSSGPYGERFFTSTHTGARRSAERILPLVLDRVQPHTAIDVGCGTGVWTQVLVEHDIDAVGIDGAYVDEASLAIDPRRFIAKDLSEGVRIDGRYDLVVSLEVAEHLPPASAELFVEDLVRLGDVVLFSAAVREQLGTAHLNEQWQSYWVERFARHDYKPFDVVRPAVWTDPAIEPWYAQNILLYVNAARADEFGLSDADAPRFVDVVHPRLHEYYQQQPQLSRVLTTLLPRAIRHHRVTRDLRTRASRFVPRGSRRRAVIDGLR